MHVGERPRQRHRVGSAVPGPAVDKRPAPGSPCQFAGEIAPGRRAPDPVVEEDQRRPVVRARSDRITSYNVCYTKLLRDVYGGGHNPEGLPVDDLIRHVEKGGKVSEFPGVTPVSNRELLEIPCDILAPCATAGQITKENAPRIRCRILAEGANGPTTLEADEILARRSYNFV